MFHQAEFQKKSSAFNRSGCYLRDTFRAAEWLMRLIICFEFVCFSGRIQNINMDEAIACLTEDDASSQVLGAAYIQHQCYNDKSAKDEVL